jgi:hypothetical protein
MAFPITSTLLTDPLLAGLMPIRKIIKMRIVEVTAKRTWIQEIVLE